MKKLNKSELERIAILVEECAEVQQIAMKIIRHGYGSHNPLDENKINNRELLNRELGDLMFAIKLMQEYFDVNPKSIETHETLKRENIQKYLHFNTV
jgi:NTP pyrophosphatase (non-canonical NTP hydrolase)